VLYGVSGRSARGLEDVIVGDDELFSRRHGLGPEPAPIRIRHDAPGEVRQLILRLVTAEVRIRPKYVREVLCTVLRRVPDDSNWSDFPNIYYECQTLLEEAPWYRVYDFVEALYRQVLGSQAPENAPRLERALNEYFVEAGIGWRLNEGRLELREGEAFDATVREAQGRLAAAGLPTAQRELQEAIGDLSRRPTPDLTGAIHHAMGALECIAREVTADPNATLGAILRRHPEILPPPLDRVLSIAWGYSSDRARHVREGGTADQAEAQLLVVLAAAACSYLATRMRT
jgi:hypothetical protein